MGKCEHTSSNVQRRISRAKGIQEEIQKYDDLVIGEFLDTYDNLPIKTFLGYKFLSEKCSGKYDYVTFTDDDSLLDLKRLKKLLSIVERLDYDNFDRRQLVNKLVVERSRTRSDVVR